jgi:sulfite reductase alpha subunit-like flavoprotein
MTVNANDTMTDEGPSCTIFYSTQTRRAKACARRTARILRETTCLKILGGTTFDDIPTSFVDVATTAKSYKHFFLFFVSTTGDGEHCDTIQQTWKSLYVMLWMNIQ